MPRRSGSVVAILTLAALEAMPAAAVDLRLLAEAMRLAGAYYASKGPCQITHREFQQALSITSVPLRRLGHLLVLLYGPFSQYSAGNDGDSFSFQLNEDAFFYQDVRCYQDIRDVQSRIAADRKRIAERLAYTWKKGGGQPPRPTQGAAWPSVESGVESMRARFSAAKSELDFQAVGLACREVLISLGKAVYNPERHVPVDGVAPSDTDVKRRLEAFFEAELGGNGNEEARRHARAAVSLANALQHKQTADYRTAALCAEATVSVVNLVSIVSNPQH